MWAVLSPFPSKREGDGSLFCALTRHKLFLRLSMISWCRFMLRRYFVIFYLIKYHLNGHWRSQKVTFILTLTYVLMDNFLSLFLFSKHISLIHHTKYESDLYLALMVISHEIRPLKELYRPPSPHIKNIALYKGCELEFRSRSSLSVVAGVGMLVPTAFASLFVVSV